MSTEVSFDENETGLATMGKLLRSSLLNISYATSNSKDTYDLCVKDTKQTAFTAFWTESGGRECFGLLMSLFARTVCRVLKLEGDRECEAKLVSMGLAPLHELPVNAHTNKAIGKNRVWSCHCFLSDTVTWCVKHLGMQLRCKAHTAGLVCTSAVLKEHALSYRRGCS